MVKDPQIIEAVLDLAVQIQQIPAPTFEEGQRAGFMLQQFIHLGITESFMDDVGNVYARIKGKGENPPVVVSAHLDTVFPAGTDLSITRTDDRIAGPGIGDNSVGLAALFGLAMVFRAQDQVPLAIPSLGGDLWLVANVSEEGLGNLTGMKAVVDRFGREALAYLILEGMSLGQIYHRGLGVKRYRIHVHTPGGHSWVDYGSPSAIHHLADLVVKIKAIPLPVEPRTSLNVGVISGGTSVNTIAADANLLLDLRSVSPRVLVNVSNQVEELVHLADLRGGEEVKVEAVVIGSRPAGEIPSDHPLVQLGIACSAVHGQKIKLNIGSTDTNEPLSRGLPAICIGLTSGRGAHTLSEYIDTKPLERGLWILSDLVQSVFEKGRIALG